MKSNVNIELRIMGHDFNPDICSKKLGIQPSEKWRENEKAKKTGAIRKYDCWLYKTGYKEVYDVNDLLKEIHSVFNEKVMAMNELIKDLNLNISLDIIIEMNNNETPALYFKKEFIDFVHSISAVIDIDMYIN